MQTDNSPFSVRADFACSSTFSSLICSSPSQVHSQCLTSKLVSLQLWPGFGSMTNDCSDHRRPGGNAKVKKSVFGLPVLSCANVKFKAPNGVWLIATFCRFSLSAVTTPLLKINFGPDERGAENAEWSKKGLVSFWKLKKGSLLLEKFSSAYRRILVKVYFKLPSCRSRLEMRMKEFIFKFERSKLSNSLKLWEPLALRRTWSLSADRAIRVGLNTIWSNEKFIIVWILFESLWWFCIIRITWICVIKILTTNFVDVLRLSQISSHFIVSAGRALLARLFPMKSWFFKRCES